MSLIDKFTLGFHKDKERRQSIMDQSKNSSLKIKSDSQDTYKQVLSQELVETLISLGFELRQIMTAYKEYKFSNIDDACYYLMKDNESGKYNHRFFYGDKGENSNYSNLNKNVCAICNGDPTEHNDFDLEDKQLINGSNKNSAILHSYISNKNYYNNYNKNFKENISNKKGDINLDLYNSNNNLKEKIEEFDSQIIDNKEKFQNNTIFGKTSVNLEHHENRIPVDKLNQEIKNSTVNTNENPGAAFITVQQATKGGQFRGSQEFAHNCDMIVEVIAGQANHQGRYAGHTEMAIFDGPEQKEQPKQETEETSGRLEVSEISPEYGQMELF